MKKLLKCGHTTEVSDDGKFDGCVCCIGTTPDAVELDEKQPDLAGRFAKCVYCRREIASKLELAFFTYDNTQEHDSFYCGCRGWD